MWSKQPRAALYLKIQWRQLCTASPYVSTLTDVQIHEITIKVAGNLCAHTPSVKSWTSMQFSDTRAPGSLRESDGGIKPTLSNHRSATIDDHSHFKPALLPAFGDFQLNPRRNFGLNQVRVHPRSGMAMRFHIVRCQQVISVSMRFIDGFSSIQIQRLRLKLINDMLCDIWTDAVEDDACGVMVRFSILYWLTFAAC